MAETLLKMRWEVEENVIMGILFGEEIKCLGSDGFEGSEKERWISMNILYGVDITNANNASSKIVNSQSKECSLNKQLGRFNTQTLVHPNPSSLNDTSVNLSWHVKLNDKKVNDVLGSKRQRLQSMTTLYSSNAKRLKMSSSDPLQKKGLVTAVTRSDNDLLNFCPLQSSNSSMAHPKQKCSQSHNDSFNESRIDRPVLSKVIPCSSMNAVNQKDKVGSFNVFGDSWKGAVTFQEGDEIRGGSYFKPEDASCKTHERNEELDVVRQQSKNDSRNAGDFFVVIPEQEHPAVGQNMLLFHFKKISELDAAEENAKDLMSKVSDANCIYHQSAINVIQNNYHLIPEVGVVSLELQHNKSFDEARMPDHGISQEVGEEMKTRPCKKRGRKKQQSGKIHDGSSHGVGEEAKIVACKRKRKEVKENTECKKKRKEETA